MRTWLSLTTAGLLGLAAALPAPTPNTPTPTLEKRSKTTLVIPAGTIVGSKAAGVESYGGIPFAEAPTGSLRLKPPVRLNTTLQNFDATGLGPACPQMLLSTGGDSLLTEVLSYLVDNPFTQDVADETEDCLTITVQRPAGTAADAKLPVLFWIYGGGFELGSPQMYVAADLILNAVSQGKPFIFAATNYRPAGFGFMPGAEILADGSANLGLLDQRMGLEWVADNIAAFGGDPEKVTIWGESAGSISVLDQMLLYDGDNTYNGSPLFRAAIMDSGSIAPADAVNCAKGQEVYDTVVEAGGCSGASDTLECLRGLPYQTFLNAANSVPGVLSYNSLALSYLPRPDGTVLSASPEELVAAGKYAAVPMIIGDQEDEGTLFALFESNITDSTDIVNYLLDVYFHDATKAQLQTLVSTYPDDASDGSPFNTGDDWNLYSEFKRMAAILGDLVFTLSRRVFLTTTNKLHPEVPSWSYLASYDYGTPYLGTFHASDLLQVFYGVLDNYASNAIQTYYFNFLYNLNPNNYTTSTGTTYNQQYMNWPQWSANQDLMQFWDDDANLLADDFRNSSYQWVANNAIVLHM